jgi:hypothetical protein
MLETNPGWEDLNKEFMLNSIKPIYIRNDSPFQGGWGDVFTNILIPDLSFTKYCKSNTQFIDIILYIRMFLYIPLPPSKGELLSDNLNVSDRF